MCNLYHHIDLKKHHSHTPLSTIKHFFYFNSMKILQWFIDLTLLISILVQFKGYIFRLYVGGNAAVTLDNRLLIFKRSVFDIALDMTEKRSDMLEMMRVVTF